MDKGFQSIGLFTIQLFPKLDSTIVSLTECEGQMRKLLGQGHYRIINHSDVTTGAKKINLNKSHKFCQRPSHRELDFAGKLPENK